MTNQFVKKADRAQFAITLAISLLIMAVAIAGAFHWKHNGHDHTNCAICIFYHSLASSSIVVYLFAVFIAYRLLTVESDEIAPSGAVSRLLAGRAPPAPRI